MRWKVEGQNGDTAMGEALFESYEDAVLWAEIKESNGYTIIGPTEVSS